MKFFIALTFLLSFSAKAGLICHIETKKEEKTRTIHTFREAHGYLGAGHILDLFVEKNTRRQARRIALGGKTSGWKGDEFLEGVIYRSEFKLGEYNRTTELTPTFRLNPGESTVLKFEDYEIKVNCIADNSF